MTKQTNETNEIKSIYANAFMNCKTCGVLTSNDKEREQHICKTQTNETKQTNEPSEIECLEGLRRLGVLSDDGLRHLNELLNKEIKKRGN